MNLTEIVRENLVKLRGKLTQTELAEKFNTTQRTISQWENSAHIKVSTMEKYANYFNIDPALLFKPNLQAELEAEKRDISDFLKKLDVVYSKVQAIKEVDDEDI